MVYIWLINELKVNLQILVYFMLWNICVFLWHFPANILKPMTASHSCYQCVVFYVNLIQMAPKYTKPNVRLWPRFQMTECGSFPLSVWGHCGSVHPKHTDPLCSTSYLKAHWPLVHFSAWFLVIRDSLNWSRWESKGVGGQSGRGHWG